MRKTAGFPGIRFRAYCLHSAPERFQAVAHLAERFTPFSRRTGFSRGMHPVGIIRSGHHVSIKKALLQKKEGAFGKNTSGAKSHPERMVSLKKTSVSSCRANILSGCRKAGKPESRKAGLAEWRTGGMAEWRNGGFSWVTLFVRYLRFG